MVARPRGWHLPSEMQRLDRRRAAVGALVDFGLHFFLNAKVLHETGGGPFYYLPKTGGASWRPDSWNDVFTYAEKRLGIHARHACARPCPSSRPFTAAFEMEEILFELREL